jgi:hypothetical protein
VDILQQHQLPIDTFFLVVDLDQDRLLKTLLIFMMQLQGNGHQQPSLKHEVISQQLLSTNWHFLLEVLPTPKQHSLQIVLISSIHRQEHGRLQH